MTSPEPEDCEPTHEFCCLDLPCDCSRACHDPANHPTDVEGNVVSVYDMAEDYGGEAYQEKLRIVRIEDDFTTLDQFVKFERSRILHLTGVSKKERCELYDHSYEVAKKRFHAQVIRKAKRVLWLHKLSLF